MKLTFERISANEDKKVSEVYEIIKISGEHMFKEQGLVHWKTPYPIEVIQKNCEERDVFLVKDIETNTYVHTFQLEFISDFSKTLINSNYSNKKEVYEVIINKFATIPNVAGKGIGKMSMDYIDEYCRNKGVSKISLDVYDKSEHAIQFYKKRGFIITGSKPTRHFTVYLMEKQI
ncbi:GNAT family N-acetyltransferase [Peribacillus butanolivorans]|uniref:GNAT family N-acetyltransferase n=1 Tax=Peribacillus butanolivorans TaxID=421767 RepID=UPI0036765976